MDFFTFGGTLDVVFGSGEVVCSFRSPAPIIRVTASPDDAPSQLAVETEALMGEIHARWGIEDEGYLCRLAEVDPLQLYVAAVNSILARYEAHPALREEDPALHSLLRAEREWLIETNRWPGEPPTLESLLAPG